MRFHGVTMKGDYKAQNVVDASALVWQGPDIDERKIVYDQVINDLWLADGSDWKPAFAYGDIPQGTEMWFYADSEPDGWTIVVGTDVSDELVAVKGGSAYSTGGGLGGDWATPPHWHQMSHAHAATGIAERATAKNGKGDSGDANIVWNHTHTLTVNVTGQTPTSTTSTDGSVSNYRPLSRTGIICSKD